MIDLRRAATDEAEALARTAHAGQTDKSGAPYIHHVEPWWCEFRRPVRRPKR